jgi:secondary thiamine-phosphate synthase enzyme
MPPMTETHRIRVSTQGRTDIVDITNKIAEILHKSKIANGIACVFVVGSTASISTLEYEPNLIKDIKRTLEKLAPENAKYDHHETWGDDNGSAHVRATLMKPSITVPFENKRLLLGTWQQIALLDFDTRPREREVVVQIIGE